MKELFIYKYKLISAVFCAFFLFFPVIVRADVQTELIGCYQVEVNEDEETLWLNAPSCEIEITNTDNNADDALTYNVRNLDPEFYQVIDDQEEVIEAERSETELSFSVYLEPGQTRTITVSPWDYESEIDDFWFAAISDPQAIPGGNIPNPVFEVIMQQLEQFALPFTTNSGDIICGTDDDAEEHDAEYEENYEVYNQFAGTTLMVPGDHDARQDLDTYYSSYFGEQNYTFTYGSTLFVAINSIENYHDEGRLTGEQLDWIESELSASTEEHIIVYMHHPLIPPSWASSSGIVEDQRLEIASLFAQYNVDLLIVGDVHGYDYSYIDEDDITGLSGGFYQLHAGGAGGSLYNYDGEHFFVLLHVTNDGIEHTRVDYNAIDFSVDYNNDNDGTENEVSFYAINNSDIEIPYFRGKVNVTPGDYYYASLSTGDFVPLISQEVDGVLRGYVELGMEADETYSVTVKQHTELLTNMSNAVNSEGYIVFDELPTSDNQETNITVTSVTEAITARVQQWDPENDLREWKVSASANKDISFQVSGLSSGQRYNIFQKNNLIDRQTAGAGAILFTHSNKKTSRTYRVEQEPSILPTEIGVLPASDGGPNYRVYNSAGSAIAAFSVFDSGLEHGYESIWIDLDGDSELEIATVPIAGQNGNVKIFKNNGEQIDSLFPFCSKFKGGINIVAGDVDADGIQELIMAAQNKKRSIVKIYSLQNQKLIKIDSFRVFNKKYEKGLNIATGDINGDNDDEIIVGARKNKKQVRVYKWLPKKKKSKLWLTKQPFTSDDQSKGLTVATGDTDFDGKDEIIVGSFTGSGMVKVYNYNSSKARLQFKSQKRVFSSGYNGGVNIVAGNLNTNHKDEIIIAQRGDETAAGKVQVYTYRNGKTRLIKLAQTAPFTTDFSEEIDVALIDIDADEKLELITAQGDAGGSITMYDLKSGGLQKIGSFYAYDRAFQGGLNLTK